MESLKKDYKTFRCLDAKIIFDNNGYIIETKNLTSIMWATQNSEELIGKHITEFLKKLKKNASSKEIYYGFLEIVVNEYLKPTEEIKKESLNKEKIKTLTLKRRKKDDKK